MLMIPVSVDHSESLFTLFTLRSRGSLFLPASFPRWFSFIVKASRQHDLAVALGRAHLIQI